MEGAGVVGKAVKEEEEGGEVVFTLFLPYDTTFAPASSLPLPLPSLSCWRQSFLDQERHEKRIVAQFVPVPASIPPSLSRRGHRHPKHVIYA